MLKVKGLAPDPEDGALTRRGRDTTARSLHHVRTHKKVAGCKPEKESKPETDPATL